MSGKNNFLGGLSNADRWTFFGSLLIAVGGCAVSVGNLLRLNEAGRLSEAAINPTIFSESKPGTSPVSSGGKARDYFSL